MQAFAEYLAYVGTLPPWLSHLIVVLVLTWTVCMIGVILVKAGRNPLWALLAFLPYAALAGLWWLAHARWPREADPWPEGTGPAKPD